MKREEGLYWVKNMEGNWTIAQWVNGYFVLPGYQQRFIPEWFDEIDERRIVRDENIVDNTPEWVTKLRVHYT